MRFIRALAVKSLDVLLSFIPISLAKILEWRIQKILGKGIGSTSLQYEVQTICFFLKKLELNNPIVFDVGANQGQFGQEFLKQLEYAYLYSFEPSKLSFDHLRRRALNNANWNCYNFGFGESECTKKLFFEVPGSASATLIEKNGVSQNQKLSKSELVKISTIEKFIRANSELIPDVLKLDVEGFELLCLQGALDYLKHIRLVQFEFGQINIETRTFFRDYWNFFTLRNFSIYRVTTKAPFAIPSYSEDLETFAVTNYIALNGTFFKQG